MAISYNMSTALFGGPLPGGQRRPGRGRGSALMPAFYMMAACVVGMIALYSVVETRGASLLASHPAMETRARVGTNHQAASLPPCPRSLRRERAG